MVKFLRRSAIASSLLVVCHMHSALAQNTRLSVQSGTTLNSTGGNIVLNNADVVSNGTFHMSNGNVVVTGVNNNSFGGSGTLSLSTLTLNAGATSVLTLNRSMDVANAVVFQHGLIDLHGQTLHLANGALLQSESEASHLTGVSGGLVTASANGVNNPNQLNIGNLGAMVTSSFNLGNVTVTRQHKPATSAGNTSLHGIQRTYLIQPQNNVALDARLRFYYLDAELAGDDASTLSLWKSTDGVSWMQIGADTRNSAARYVEKAGLTDFSYWTLTDLLNPLPLTLVSFRVGCENGSASVEWKTGVESDIDRFYIERSTDGTSWVSLGSVTALNITGGSSYSYMDDHAPEGALYRLKILDRSGMTSYSPVFKGGCSDIAMPFMVYPNPAEVQAVARLSVRQATQATIQIMNMNGQVLYNGTWSLRQGVNEYVLPVSGLAAGAYVVKLYLPGSSLESMLIKK